MLACVSYAQNMFSFFLLTELISPIRRSDSHETSTTNPTVIHANHPHTKHSSDHGISSIAALSQGINAYLRAFCTLRGNCAQSILIGVEKSGHIARWAGSWDCGRELGEEEGGAQGEGGEELHLVWIVILLLHR